MFFLLRRLSQVMFTKAEVWQGNFKNKTAFNSKMEFAITKMSENGQVVIPKEIRKEAKLKPATKFLVFSEKGNIYLKVIKNSLPKDLQLLEDIRESEEEIKKGRFVKADTSMSPEEIDRLLMS